MAEGEVLRRWLPSVRRTMVAFLLLQAMVALLVFSENIWRAIQFHGRDEVRTITTLPVAPGDQTRPYSPAEVPSRPDRERRFLAPITIPESLPTRLTFTIQETEERGLVLLMSGEIDDSAARRFRSYLEDLTDPPDTVALHSPGGNVLQSLQIGRLIRERGFATHVSPDAACLSACPYILAGGIERTVSEAAWVGLHQSYFDQSLVVPVFFAVRSIQTGQAEVMEYLNEMGVDPLIVVPALKTPPDEIYLLVEEEMLAYRLATTVTQ
ncbi:MAG: hypothetical protein KF887_12505 [Paracoccaceae bacterium]|nr:MAG: hypothetical protein KF887_12505 [Paracoccaceae bacterium]